MTGGNASDQSAAQTGLERVSATIPHARDVLVLLPRLDDLAALAAAMRLAGRPFDFAADRWHVAHPFFSSARTTSSRREAGHIHPRSLAKVGSPPGRTEQYA